MIGVFDSGHGGLTILRALREHLPEYTYQYLSDEVHAPYGECSPEDIFRFTTEGVEQLFSQGCELVILACNTASAHALRRIQQEVLPARHPDKKVLGIIVPTIEQITGASWSHTQPITTPIAKEQFIVGVLATSSTVASNVYAIEIHKRNPSVRVIQQACPGLATLIQQSAPREQIVEKVTQCLNELQFKAGFFHTLLLGCTHYELIADIIKESLATVPGDSGGAVKMHHQPSIVAQSLKAYLACHPEIKQKLISVANKHS